MDDSRHQPPEPPDDEAASLRRPISIRRIRLQESELDQRARQVGTAVGTMVALLRDAQHKLNEGDLWKLTNPMSDLRTTAQGRTQESRNAAALRAAMAAYGPGKSPGVASPSQDRLQAGARPEQGPWTRPDARSRRRAGLSAGSGL